MTTVTKKFDPYNYREVQEFNREVSKTLGKYGVRWRHTIAFDPEHEPKGSSRHINYSFNDPQDATLFVLKFGGVHND